MLIGIAMVKARIGHDFMIWTSFPSSVKLFNPEPKRRGWWTVFDHLPVTPKSKIKIEINAKSDNLPAEGYGSYLSIFGSKDGVEYKGIGIIVPRIKGVTGIYGKKDWDRYVTEGEIPADVRMIRGYLVAAQGDTWFDDLKIYMDDVLIYQDDFANWNPYIGAGLGGVAGAIAGYLINPEKPLVPALVGLALGTCLGGGVGYFTAVPRASSPESPERQVQYATVR